MVSCYTAATLPTKALIKYNQLITIVQLLDQPIQRVIADGNKLKKVNRLN